MKPILVHVHVYYPEMWEELKLYLKNLEAYPYDLYVTFVENHKKVIEDVKSFKPEARIEVLENKGFDVGPFVCVLNQVNLDDYSYIIKLHTKRDLGSSFLHENKAYSGGELRKLMMSFLEKEKLDKTIKAMERDKKLGMSANHRLILNHGYENERAIPECEKILINLNLPTTNNFEFVSGTMFIVKAFLLKPVQQMNLSLNDFEVTARGENSFAHSLEILFGWLVKAQGYKIEDVNISRRKQKLANFFESVKLFLYRKKVTKKGKTIIKICKIPIKF